MASGSKKKGTPKKKSAVNAARSSVVAKKQVPWGTIAAVVGIVLLAGAVFGYYYVASGDKRAQAEREESAAAFAPTDKEPNPSNRIEGVVTEEYSGGAHVLPTERVAYDKTPPFGGPHDGFWAACNGVVYPNPVRTENMVHSLEHGAVWIAYDPDRIQGDDLDTLKVRAEGKPFTMMSPYPGLDSPIALQSWGHQLKLESVDDERIDQFIAALRRNANTYPEIGASCDALGPGRFDPDNPPAFDPAPPGPDAKPMDYKGSDGAADEQMGGGQQAPTPPAGG
ncbi:hypothetical protein BAY61_25575 [Prauserella marina]|uniref:Uncharacterized protein n=1 Tax=Prauserella marina TaxID=530584 RepID=A0A222VV91_9PSEU|nr:DUF3105 domain-containing protein [Prauserella marina]ASR37815.1 hypothetical protein BAY61_25575 [Prauserella marina]PWV75774.1 uncharacterized protein DUF3105 [Prauserella marina]SDD26499.1 Protein of unknown function [Prauserella marina]